MEYNNLLAKEDFTENELAYIANFKSIAESVPSREISIFRPPIRTRDDLLKTIVWKKSNDTSFYYLANTAIFSHPKYVEYGKRANLYDDSSFEFWKLKNEKEFSDRLTSFINEYLPSLKNSLSVPHTPSTDINEVFLRHYKASIDLLLRGPPHANEHQIDTELAEDWIQSHKTPERRRLARLLIKNTLYISHKELLDQIQESIKQIQSKLIPGLPTIFLAGPQNKSNYYISLLFYHFWNLAGLPVHTIKVYMDEIVAGNIIDIDEMAYSGTQTTSTLSKVYSLLVDKIIENLLEVNCKETQVKAFCQSRNFFPLMLFEKILAENNVNYILVRIFCSENGKVELLRMPHSSYNNPLKFPSHLIIGRILPSPKTLFGEKNAAKLSILYGIDPGNPASTAYFNHKVANLPSTFLFPYAYGVVPNAPLLSRNDFWTSSANERKKFNDTIQNLETSTNTDAVEFKPFIQYCGKGTRFLPKTRKNLKNYEPPNSNKKYSLSQAELPQIYRCPYAWYKKINYETGTYKELPLPNLPPLPYGPTEENFIGGRKPKARKTQRNYRK